MIYIRIIDVIYYFQSKTLLELSECCEADKAGCQRKVITASCGAQLDPQIIAYNGDLIIQ